MSLPSRLCAVALLAAALGGCNAIGNALGSGGGVMPESDVGPPPSMRSTLKTARERSTAVVDEDGNPVPVAPTRQLALPKTVKGETRTADSGPRRINREDIEGADTGGRRSGGGMAPAMTPGGGVGLGGKF